jgi:hypothetical protein
MSLAVVEAPAVPDPPDSHALCRAIAGLPNDEVTAALVKVAGSAGRWSGTAGLAIGDPGTGGVRFPVGELAAVFYPDTRASLTFTADELSSFLATLVRDRSEPPPGLHSMTLENGLTVWGRTGSCATHVAGMYATPDLSRVLVFAYRLADEVAEDREAGRPYREALGQGIVRAAFDPDDVPVW